MFRNIKLFTSDKRGSVAILTAGSLSLLVVLAAGATELAQIDKVRSSMQESADSSLLTSLRLRQLDWSKRVQAADKIFKTNFSHHKMVSHLNSDLTATPSKDRLILQLKASARVKKFMPAGLSFAKETVEVIATAEISRYTKYEARLITTPKNSVVVNEVPVR